MKHAYLIMAHNNFGVLQRLIDALDHECNDIIVHIDKKVKTQPELTVVRSNLYFCCKRVSVHWGHCSQIEAEFVLFEESLQRGNYDYVHLISGTHFPLHNQDIIHEFFNNHHGISVVSPQCWTREDVLYKLGLRHYFLANANSVGLFSHVCNILWRLSMRLQPKSQKRADLLFHGKFSQWLSLSHSDLQRILPYKREVHKKFKYSFCGDELFMPYIFHKAGIKPFEFPKLLFQNFVGASPKNIDSDDFKSLVNSGFMFARKFSDNDLNIIDRISSTY